MSACPRPIHEIEADFAGADIYVFSDRAESRALTRDVVHTFGRQRVRDFDTLAECFSEAMDQRPQLVILDLTAILPAVQVNLQRLRNDRGCCALPVLVRIESLTGWGLSQLIHHGATDVVMASLHSAQCMARVRTMLEGKAEPAKLPGKGVFRAIQDAQAELCLSVLPEDGRLERIRRHYRLDLDCLFRAQEKVGGDLWDVLPIDASRVAFFSADFCGHGLHVAPHTLRLAGLMRSSGFDKGDPAQVLAWVNDRLHALLPAGQFAAMAYAVIDTRADELIFSCSAHMPPIVRAGRNDPWMTAEIAGLPLGFVSGAAFETVRMPFASGAGLILHSDALVETPLPPVARFTSDSLCDFCSALPEGTESVEINASLVQALDLDRVPLEDDLTILTIQRL